MSTKRFIAVACAQHVRIGRAHGFMQVCHGKAAPLRRLSPGDLVAYYSPTESFGGKDRLQAFTAIGVVAPGVPYGADEGGDICMFRRGVLWSEAIDTPIRPLLESLSFARDNPNWGYQLRFGLFQIEEEDMRTIASAMRATLRPFSPEAAVTR
jgi:EVE domain-containing protein